MKTLFCILAFFFISIPANALYFLDLPISHNREATIKALESLHFHKVPVQLSDGTQGFYETEGLTKLFGKFQEEWCYLTLFHTSNSNIISGVWLEKDSFEDWESLLKLRATISDIIESELSSPSFFCNTMDMDKEQKEVMDARFGDEKHPTVYSMWIFADLHLELIADVDNLTLKVECLYK